MQASTCTLSAPRSESSNSPKYYNARAQILAQQITVEPLPFIRSILKNFIAAVFWILWCNIS